MARLGKRKRYGGPVLGLDLRDGGVRAAVVAPAGQSWRVQSSVTVAAPSAGEDPSGLPDLLRQALGQLRPAPRKAAVVLGFQHVLIRRLKMPRMPMGRLRQLIEREGERYIPFYGEGANFDLHLLREERGARQIDLLLVAVPSRLIHPLEAACREAKLQLAAVDLDLAALSRAMLATDLSVEPSGTKAVLEVGPSVVRMGLLQDGALLGGRALDREGEDMPELAVAIRRSLEVLLSQQKEAGKLEQLLLTAETGAATLADELLPLLQADIGHRLAEGFSIRTLGADLPEGFAPAVGGALCRAAAPLSFNLLPRLTFVQRQQRTRKALLWFAGAAALAGYGWYWSQTVPQAQHRIARAEQTIRESEQDLKRRPEVQKLEQKQKEYSMVLADMRASETPLHQVLPAIEALAPNGLEFTDFSGQVPNLSVKGHAVDPALVVDVLAKLSGEPYVEAVELRSVVATTPERFAFDLAVTLKGQKRGATSGATTATQQP